MLDHHAVILNILQALGLGPSYHIAQGARANGTLIVQVPKRQVFAVCPGVPGQLHGRMLQYKRAAGARPASKQIVLSAGRFFFTPAYNGGQGGYLGCGCAKRPAAGRRGTAREWNALTPPASTG